MNMNNLKGNNEIFVNGTLHCTFCWFLMAATGIDHDLYGVVPTPTLTHVKLFMPSFSWSIFIRAVIDHMICYNLNWPKIRL